MKNRRNFGFSLIGVLLIIGVLILTAGGVVWEKATIYTTRVSLSWTIKA